MRTTVGGGGGGGTVFGRTNIGHRKPGGEAGLGKTGGG